ncbi:MAG: substrate-binding domain-containing protein [Sneathiellaceae bacterium]
MKRRDMLKLTGLAIGGLALPAISSPLVLAAEQKKLVMVVKIIGIPWYNLVEQGLKKAGKEFDFDVSMVGPSNIDPAQQVRLVEDLIARQADYIGLVPLDEKVMAPVLARAQDAGIKVITEEGPNQAGRDWDVALVDNKQFGEATMKSLAEGMGGKGEYVVYVGTLTTPLHNQWADAAIAYQKANYPEMKLATERFPGADEIDTAQRNTLDVLKAHPNLRGIVAYGSNGAIGAGNAIRQQRRQDQVTLVGTSVPSQAAAMIKDGTIRETFLWNPFDTGYALVAVAKLMRDGATFEDGMTVPGLGEARVDVANKRIAINKIMVVNKDTIDELLAMGI